MWSPEDGPYQGKHYQLAETICRPAPIQQPRPPVLVGAGASEKTFGWIARSADGWITTPIEQDIEDNVTLLRKIWADAGRTGEPEIIVLAGKPDADKLARWQDLGVSEALFGMPDADEEQVVAYLQRLASKLGIGG